MPGPRSPAELQEILGFNTNLARKAGALILEGSYSIQRAPGPGSVGEKKNAVDLVTEYDVRVEELVRSEIARIYPHFHLLAYRSAVSDPFPPARVLNVCLALVALAKNRTPLGPAHRSRIRRPFVLTLSVRSYIDPPIPPQSTFFFHAIRRI